MAALFNVFCFPFAGGSSWNYRDLARQLDGKLRLIPVELPGRGTRRTETPIAQWSELTGRLADELAPRLDAPYAFFGYSLGALVALETQRELTHRYPERRAQTLIACAARGPRAIRHEHLMHRMDDQAMFEAVRKLGGIPDAVLESPELIQLAAPSMRADLCLFETYEAGKPPLDLPIHAYYGRNDASVGEHYLAWQHETSHPLRSRAFHGGHMFLHDAGATLAEALVKDLVPHANTRPAFAGELDARRESMEES